MSTTVTLDDDVAKPLHEQATREGVSLDQVVNEKLRKGIETQTKPFRIDGPFVRSRPGISFDKIQEVLDEAEGPLRK